MGSLKRLRERVAKHHREDERGASLVEYALMVALIAVVCITAITLIGTKSNSQYSRYNQCVNWAGSNGPVPANCQR